MRQSDPVVIVGAALTPMSGVTLLAAMAKRGASRGVASRCIGGGEATAMAVERLH